MYISYLILLFEQRLMYFRQIGGDRHVNWGIVTHEHVAQEHVYLVDEIPRRKPT